MARGGREKMANTVLVRILWEDFCLFSLDLSGHLVSLFSVHWFLVFFLNEQIKNHHNFNAYFRCRQDGDIGITLVMMASLYQHCGTFMILASPWWYWRHFGDDINCPYIDDKLSTAQHSTANPSPSQHSTAQHSTAQNGTQRYRMTQNSTVQQSTTQ